MLRDRASGRAASSIAVCLGVASLVACNGGDGPAGGNGVSWLESESSEIVAIPSRGGATGVDVAATPSGAVLTTWLEPLEGSERTALRWSRYDPSPAAGSAEPTAATLVESDRLFANWADFPHVIALSDGNVIVTYLERLGDGKYDYGVRFVGSTDGGSTWSEPRWLHDHVGPGEHGFVSLARQDERTAVAVWLDGRETAGGEHGAGGAMTLRMRSVAVDGALGPERLLDPRVCDCCQTDVARAGDGAWLVAYRDRSEDEVRDVKVLRVAGDDVSAVFDSRDHFRFEGCPVNGPALAAHGERVALVWFAPDLAGGGSVRVATSLDGGASFPNLTTLDAGRPEGRVEVLFEGCGGGSCELDRVYAVWLGELDGGPAWRFARFFPSLADERGDGALAFGTLAPTTGAREVGFPRAVAAWKQFLAAYVSSQHSGRVVLHRAGWYPL